jgi:hypothetical protein
LKRCQLGEKNLDSLVTIYKNWPNNVKVGCNVANEDVIEFFVVKVHLLEYHEIELGEAMMFEEKQFVDFVYTF